MRRITVRTTVTIDWATRMTGRWYGTTRALHHWQPGFRAARLLRGAARPGHSVIQTEWDSREHHDRFIQALGLPWLDDALGLWAGLLRVA